MSAVRSISPVLARRLAVTRQRLSGPQAPSDAEGIMQVVRDLGCLQLDPISVVARSHRLVLFSRVGVYDLAELEKLLWQERKLFEYWAHAASIVLTEDYPIHSLLMRRYPKSDSTWHKRIRAWMAQNRPLQRHILTELRRKGPLPSRYFQEQGIPSLDWVSTGWTSGRNISRMLDFMWIQGKIMVAGRAGQQKLWDLTERFLPEWTPRERLSEHEVVRRAAPRSLRALGIARDAHIMRHFIGGRYPHLERVLDELEREAKLERIEIRDGRRALPGTWYVHADDGPLLDRLADGDWQPRTTLLSPFDNLIRDRARTRLLFDFDFTLEIYTPQDKRKYGYYVLPILHGDRLIGRIDPAMDRAQGRLTVHAVHAEPEAPMDRQTARAVAGAIEELGVFLRAREIVYSRRVPAGWRGALR